MIMIFTAVSQFFSQLTALDDAFSFDTCNLSHVKVFVHQTMVVFSDPEVDGIKGPKDGDIGDVGDDNSPDPVDVDLLGNSISEFVNRGFSESPSGSVSVECSVRFGCCNGVLSVILIVASSIDGFWFCNSGTSESISDEILESSCSYRQRAKKNRACV